MNKCIFCLSDSGNFSTREHVFPESIGNQTKLLPMGAVCDTCNHGVLSQLDQAFVEFEPVAMLKATFQIPSKHGELKALHMGDTKFKHLAKGHIKIIVDNSEQIIKFPDGARFSSTSKRKLEADRVKLIARAILKQAYECAFLDHGGLMLDSKYDELRTAINDGRNFSSYIALRKKTEKPSPEKCELKYMLINTGETSGILATMTYCGLGMGVTFPGGSSEGLTEEQFDILRFDNSD